MKHFVPMLGQFVPEPRTEKQTRNIDRVQNGNALITLSSQFNKTASDTRNKQNTNFTHISIIHYSFLLKKKKKKIKRFILYGFTRNDKFEKNRQLFVLASRNEKKS